MEVQFELIKGLSFVRKSVDGVTVYRFKDGKPVTVKNEDDIRGFRVETDTFKEVGTPSKGDSKRKPLAFKKFDPRKKVRH